MALDGLPIQGAFHVDYTPVWLYLRENPLQRQVDEFTVRNRQHQGVGRGQGLPGDQVDTVVLARFGRGGSRVVNMDCESIFPQLGNYVGDLAVSKVRAVFLEGEAQHVDGGAAE